MCLYPKFIFLDPVIVAGFFIWFYSLAVRQHGRSSFLDSGIRHDSPDPTLNPEQNVGKAVIIVALTKKRQRFCEEYLIDLCGTQAAIRAGYSVETAGSIASELLTIPEVRARIETAMAARSRRVGVNADRVLQELGKVAFINAVDVINMNDATLADDADRDDTAAIASVKVKTFPTEAGEGIEREIRLADKLKALELCGRHLGMFKDQVNINVDLELSDRIKKSRERAANGQKTDNSDS